MPFKNLLLFAALWLGFYTGAQCPPALTVTLPTYTLTCFTPTILATGSSTTSNTQIVWTQPFPPPNIYQPTIVIGPPQGMQGFPPPYTTYTVTATNTLNSCSAVSIINIYYNFKPPVSSPSITAPAYICNNPVLLGKGNSTVTSGIPGATVTVMDWAGPPPQLPWPDSITYKAYVPGIYTLTVRDSQNGCQSSGTVNLPDGRPFFTLSGMAPTSSSSCNGYAVVTPSVNSGYTIQTSMGSVSGNTISSLCYGNLKVCLTDVSNGCKRCDSLLINGATSLAEIETGDLVIFPNPGARSFSLRNTLALAMTIDFFNMEGRHIADETLQGGEERKLEITTPGLYFLEIKTGGGLLRKKLVVLDQ